MPDTSFRVAVYPLYLLFPWLCLSFAPFQFVQFYNGWHCVYTAKCFHISLWMCLSQSPVGAVSPATCSLLSLISLLQNEVPIVSSMLVYFHCSIVPMCCPTLCQGLTNFLHWWFFLYITCERFPTLTVKSRQLRKWKTDHSVIQEFWSFLDFVSLQLASFCCCQVLFWPWPNPCELSCMLYLVQLH